MELFGIIFIALVIAIIVFLALWGICSAIDNQLNTNINWTWFVALILALCAWVGFIFIGLNINENSHKAYAQKYLIQKETIEMSLENDNLSGFERVELVKQAVELNGELAERKTNIKYWYSGVFDNTIYDNIKFIKLD